MVRPTPGIKQSWPSCIKVPSLGQTARGGPASRAVRQPAARRRDVDTHYALHIAAAGPTGQHREPAWSTKFQLRRGRHVYSFRLEGSNERFDIPLDVVVQ